jgi:hypothetical protein
LDDRGFKSWEGLGIFLFTTASRLALGPTQPPRQWVPEALSLRVKRPGREVDHSPPCSAEIENAWSCTSSLQYAFMAWCSFKAQEQLHVFTFMYISNYEGFYIHETLVSIFLGIAGRKRVCPLSIVILDVCGNDKYRSDTPWLVIY